MLLLDLYFTNVAGMLDDFRDVRFVSSSDLTRNALRQICESTVHPVLPEDTNTVAKRSEVGQNHTERSVDGPEKEENNEEVVGVPEALKVCTSSLLCCCECDGHQCYQHDIAAPTGTCCEVCQKKAHESKFVFC